MTPRPPVPPSSRRDRGSVIIFVLGIILLVVFLLTRLMDRAAVELAAENKAVRRVELRQEAESALEASFAVLADFAAADNGLRDPADGWGRPLELIEYRPSEGYAVDVSVVDETGKVSLPQADAERLAAYLEVIGCPLNAVDFTTDALLSWTKPDHVPLEGETADFANSPLPYAAPQRALRSFEELRAVPALRELFFDEQGRWNALGLRFKEGASLFSFGAANVNTAGADVLRAHGLDLAQSDAIEAARRARLKPGAAYRTPAELAGAWGRESAPPGLGTEASCLHLTVEARQGGRSYRFDAWISRQGNAAVPPRLPSRLSDGTTATPPPEAASVRSIPRKRLDSPFAILELRGNDDL